MDYEGLGCDNNHGSSRRPMMSGFSSASELEKETAPRTAPGAVGADPTGLPCHSSAGVSHEEKSISGDYDDCGIARCRGRHRPCGTGQVHAESAERTRVFRVQRIRKLA